jgi:hypothetical protein
VIAYLRSTKYPWLPGYHSGLIRIARNKSSTGTSNNRLYILFCVHRYSVDGIVRGQIDFII